MGMKSEEAEREGTEGEGLLRNAGNKNSFVFLGRKKRNGRNEQISVGRPAKMVGKKKRVAWRRTPARRMRKRKKKSGGEGRKNNLEGMREEVKVKAGFPQKATLLGTKKIFD